MTRPRKLQPVDAHRANSLKALLNDEPFVTDKALNIDAIHNREATKLLLAPM